MCVFSIIMLQLMLFLCCSIIIPLHWKGSPWHKKSFPKRCFAMVKTNMTPIGNLKHLAKSERNCLETAAAPVMAKLLIVLGFFFLVLCYRYHWYYFLIIYSVTPDNHNLMHFSKWTDKLGMRSESAAVNSLITLALWLQCQSRRHKHVLADQRHLGWGEL